MESDSISISFSSEIHFNFVFSGSLDITNN